MRMRLMIGALVVATAAGFMLSGAGWAQAQTQGEPKTANSSAAAPAKKAKSAPKSTVVYIDLQEILRRSKAGRSLRPLVEKWRAGIEKAEGSANREAKKKQTDLVNQRGLLAPEAYAQRVRKAQSEVAAAGQKIQDMRREADRKLTLGRNQVLAAVQEITVKLAREQGYVIVLLKSQTFIASQHLNITAFVLKELDKRMTKVNAAALAANPKAAAGRPVAKPR